jgi:hypothetical protein
VIGSAGRGGVALVARSVDRGDAAAEGGAPVRSAAFGGGRRRYRAAVSRRRAFVCTRIGEQGPIVARMDHIVVTTVAGQAGWRGRSPLLMRDDTWQQCIGVSS